MKKTLGLAAIAALVITTFTGLAPANAAPVPCGGKPKVDVKLVVEMKLEKDTIRNFTVYPYNYSTGTKTFQNVMGGAAQAPSQYVHLFRGSDKVVSRLEIPAFKCQISANSWKLQLNYSGLGAPSGMVKSWDINFPKTGKTSRKSQEKSAMAVSAIFHGSKTPDMLTSNLSVTTELFTCLGPKFNLKDYLKGLQVITFVGSQVKGPVGTAFEVVDAGIDLWRDTLPTTPDTCGVRHPALVSNSATLTDLNFTIDSTGKITPPGPVSYSHCTTNYKYGTAAPKAVSVPGSSSRRSACPAKLELKSSTMSPNLSLTGGDSVIEYTLISSVKY